VVGQFATRAAFNEQSARYNSWALQRARKIAATGEPGGEYRYLFYDALAFVAFSAGEADPGQSVLTRMAQSALEERNAVQLVNGGYSYFEYRAD